MQPAAVRLGSDYDAEGERLFTFVIESGTVGAGMWAAIFEGTAHPWDARR